MGGVQLPHRTPEVTEIWGSQLSVIPTARSLTALLSSSVWHTVSGRPRPDSGHVLGVPWRSGNSHSRVLPEGRPLAQVLLAESYLSRGSPEAIIWRMADGGAGAEAGLRGRWAHTCRQLGVASELTEGSGQLKSYLLPAPWRGSCGLYPIGRQS